MASNVNTELKLSDNIENIFTHPEGDTVSVREILDRVSHKSFGVFLAILALPSALPVPAPGYSVPFGIVLIILGCQMILNREQPWFPDKVLDRRIKANQNNKAVQFMVKFLKFFEFFIRPRLSFVYTNGLFFRGLGLIVLTCGISMCIPVPLTNTGPALGIFLIGLGTLEEDGLFGLGGAFVSLLGLLLAASVLGVIVYLVYSAGTGTLDETIVQAGEIVKDFIKRILGMGGGDE